MMKRLTTQELIVRSDALDISDPYRPVSLRSRWRDAVWRLDHGYFGASSHGAAIPWYDDIHPDCIELLKKVVWSTLVDPADRRITPSTFACLCSSIAVLGRFMTKWEHHDLLDFDAVAMGYLAANLREMVQGLASEEYDDVDLEDEDAEEDDLEYPDSTRLAASSYTNGKLSFNVVKGVFLFVSMIYRQRRQLRALGVQIHDEDPMGGEGAKAWALRVRIPKDPESYALPDEIAIPLMISVDRLLGRPAEQVIDLQDKYLTARALRRGEPTNRHQRARAERAVAGWEFAILNGESEPWHPSLPLIKRDGAYETVSKTIRNLVTSIRDAAVLALLQQTGMRIGEIVALRATDDPSTGLPLCVVRKTSSSGSRNLFYVESIVNKGRPVPERELWLIGASPFGSEAVPTTVRAIQILNRILDPWRDLAMDGKARVSLLVYLVAGGGLPDTPAGVNPPTVNNVSNGVRQTYARLLDWSALPDRARTGEDLTRYKAKNGFCIKPTQWRKTFATNIVRTDSRLLNALRRHFKHMNLETTESDYIGNRPQMLEDADEAQMQMTMRFLRARTSATAPAIGKTGLIIQRNLKRIRQLDEAGHPIFGDTMEAALTASETGLWHSDHGACAITISPMKARCHELAGDPSFLNDRPNFALQRPEVCLGCRCFVADPSHLPYWRRRFLENNEAKRAHRRIGDHGPASIFEMKARRAWPIVRVLRRQAGTPPEMAAIGHFKHGGADE